MLPEDYNEAGALWEHLDRGRVPFFNFGFGTEMPATIETEAERNTGVRMAVAFPIPKPLFDRMNAAHRYLLEIEPDAMAGGIKRQPKREHAGWWN